MNARQNRMELILLGPTKAGKTELANVLFKKNDFNEEKAYEPTIGVAMVVFKLKEPNNGANIESICWDTSGQDKFGLINKAYCKNVNVLLCVFDITDLESLKAAHTIALGTNLCTAKDPTIIYVGTQNDISDKPHISDADITTIIGSNSVIKVSAKTKENIDELRRQVEQEIFADYHKQNVKEQDDEPADTSVNGIKQFIKESRDTLLNEQLNHFLEQIDKLKANEPSSSEPSSKKPLLKQCQEYVYNALTAKTDYQKEVSLKNLHRLAASFSSVKQLKAVSICMMAIGAILSLVGVLAIAVSSGPIATGVLAPLGVLGVAGGIGIAAVGGAIFAGGATLFAKRHSIFNPLDSAHKIETLLKQKK